MDLWRLSQRGRGTAAEVDSTGDGLTGGRVLSTLPAMSARYLEQAELCLGLQSPTVSRSAGPAEGLTLQEELAAFEGCGTGSVWSTTTVQGFEGQALRVPVCTNEFWTARQRQANRLHEISYRACFKPQLPRFFIERLTAPGDRVYDPFMGRGTTLLEASLLGRIPLGNDVNPLSRVLCEPRLRPPEAEAVARRLAAVDWGDAGECPGDLLAFYHPSTLSQISALRKYLLGRRAVGVTDPVDAWLEMVAVNRLTGHSGGFFSVYTLPPNQATSVKAQRRINERRSQVPPERDVSAIILKKTRQLLGDCSPGVRSTLDRVAGQAQLLSRPAEATPEIEAESVALVVTSPPFLNIVQYATDNWLRCWFLGIDARSVPITVPGNVKRWQVVMSDVFRELYRVVRSGGHVAFEVGEVRGGTTRLEEAVLPCGVAAGFRPELIMIHAQVFTKTANCWGVDNNTKGTNTNRIVVFRKD